VLQGERSMARDNRTMGRFHLTGLPPAMRGLPQIEVTFDIDANGIVNVAAMDKATGKEQKITITGASGLAKDEVNRLVKEAEANAQADAKQREDVDARNRAEAEAYQKEQAAKAAQESGAGSQEPGTGNQSNPADAAKDGEVVDAEFAEAK
jgi:molecular chaperone DnaK